MRGNRLLKYIDRYLGILIIFLLSIFTRKKKPSYKENESVAFFAPVAIGDTILILSTIQKYRTSFPMKKITIFCSPLSIDLVSFFIKDIEVIPIKITSVLETVKIIRQYKFNQWYDFSQWARLSSIISFFAKADNKHGFSTKLQFRNYTYTNTVEHLNNVHELENFGRLLNLSMNTKDIEPITKKNSDQQNRNIIIHICPSGERSHLKMWPTDRWISITNYLLSRNKRVIFTGAGKDIIHVKKVIDKFSTNDNIINLVDKTSIKDLPKLIEDSKLIITVNTGILHIASFTNTPIIVLNGPTNPNRWGPVSSNAISLTPKLECAPCLNLGFEYGCNKNDCMKDIGVKQVINAIESLL